MEDLSSSLSPPPFRMAVTNSSCGDDCVFVGLPCLVYLNERAFSSAAAAAFAWFVAARYACPSSNEVEEEGERGDGCKGVGEGR